MPIMLCSRVETGPAGELTIFRTSPTASSIVVVGDNVRFKEQRNREQYNSSSSSPPSGPYSTIIFLSALLFRPRTAVLVSSLRTRHTALTTIHTVVPVQYSSTPVVLRTVLFSVLCSKLSSVCACLFFSIVSLMD